MGPERMKRINLKKRGVLYTLSLSLFALVLLALAILFFRHANSTESRHVELSFSQKIYGLDTSIQQIFAESFERESNITASFDGQSITIQEALPLDFTELDNVISTLKTDVENDFTIVNINTESFLSNHTLIFEPLNITYEHESINRIHILPNLNINGYDITLTFFENITSCITDIEDEGPIDINFTAQSPGDNCIISQENAEEAEITLVVGGENISVDIEEDGEFNLESNATVESSITINVAENNQQGHFELPISIEISDSALGFSKQGNVQLPLPSYS